MADVCGPRSAVYAMDASTVCGLVAQLEQAAVTVWLDGGWGVDALLGRETRPHHNLDILVRVSDVPALLAVCEPAGFGVREGSIPHAFVLASASGLRLDVHSVTFRPDGTAVHRMENGNDWVFSADAFSGVGSVEGARVSCLSPDAQVRCHAQGYSPTEKDFRDMELSSALARLAHRRRARGRSRARSAPPSSPQTSTAIDHRMPPDATRVVYHGAARAARERLG